jgi:hypothetical protein
VLSATGPEDAARLISHGARDLVCEPQDCRLANWLLAGLALAAVTATLAGCGSPGDTSLEAAVSHPDSVQAARYVAISENDLPAGYTTSRPTAQVNSEDASQTLAEYMCEHLDPPNGPSPISARTPDFVNSTGITELHETTAVFASASAASAPLFLELNRRYPTCKAAAFRRALVANAPKGERIGSVTVHVTNLPPRFGDLGVQVEGLSTLDLPGGVSTLATSDLVVLIRDRMVAELSIDTDGPAPIALLDRLTADLAEKMAQVEPNASHN